MHIQLRDILAMLLRNGDVLGKEVLRLGRSEQFKHSEQCFTMIEQIRDHCNDTLALLSTIERRLYARDLLPPKEERENTAEY